MFLTLPLGASSVKTTRTVLPTRVSNDARFSFVSGSGAFILRAAVEPIIPGAAAEADLDEVLGSDAARESFYAYGGALAQLLARLGAYTHHPIDETDYHEQKGVGYPHGRLRKNSVLLDPTLRFEEYAHLLSRGPVVCGIIARHPSTPEATVLEIARAARAAANAPPPPVIAAPPQPEPVIEDAELERMLDAARRRESPEQLAGPAFRLLRRVGAFDYNYWVEEGEETWYDGNSVVGRGPAKVTRFATPPDPLLPYAAFARLLELAPGTENGRRARRLVAGHPSTPPEVLLLLARDGDDAVRFRAADHAATPLAVLNELATDSRKNIRQAISRRPTLDHSTRALVTADPELARDLAGRQDTTPEELLAIAANPDAAFAIAEHPRCPAEALRRAAQPSCHFGIQMAFARNANTPDDVLAMLLKANLTNVLIAIAHRQTLLPLFIERLAGHSSVNVRVQLAKRSDLPAMVREQLTKDNAVQKILARR